MKEICKRLNIDTKIYKERSLLAAISSAKDELVSPTQFALQAAASSDFAKKKQAQVYQEYQAALQKNNADVYKRQIRLHTAICLTQRS